MLIFLPIMVCCSALTMSPIIPNIDCFIRVSSTVDGVRFAGLQFQRYGSFHRNTITLPWL